jgi:hypothetical protein
MAKSASRVADAAASHRRVGYFLIAFVAHQLPLATLHADIILPLYHRIGRSITAAKRAPDADSIALAGESSVPCSRQLYHAFSARLIFRAACVMDILLGRYFAHH